MKPAESTENGKSALISMNAIRESLGSGTIKSRNERKKDFLCVPLVSRSSHGADSCRMCLAGNFPSETTENVT